MIGSLAFGEPFGMVDREADIVLVENEKGKVSEVRPRLLLLVLTCSDAWRADPQRAWRVLGDAGLPAAVDPSVPADRRPRASGAPLPLLTPRSGSRAVRRRSSTSLALRATASTSV